MKILVLTPTFLPAVGGAELVLYEVYQRLAERHEVTLLTPVLAPELLEHHASDEYPDSRIPFAVRRYEDRVTLMRIPGHKLSGGALPPFSLSAVKATHHAIRELGPDVLNVHYLMPTGLAGIVAERLGVPTVFTMNGRDVPGPGVPPLWRWWQRALIAFATDVTYVSGYCRRAIYRTDDGPGTVIYAGVEIPPAPGDGRALRRELSIPDDQFLILALGRLSPEKRVDVVVRAMRRFLDGGGRGILLVGGTGPDAEPLRSLAADLGMTDRVRFTGFIPTEDLPSYFDACDAFAFHSTYETFGIVIAQAMSYGKPIVTANNTALPEVLGDAGLLADTNDVEGFGDALLLLRDNLDLRQRLGAAGRARAAAYFNWDEVALQYEVALTQATGFA